MFTLTPRTAVQWPTPTGVNVGTTLAPADVTATVPAGHTPVRTAGGVLNVMTIALRPWAPSAASVAEMRTWLADCAPTDDALDLIADLSDGEVLRATVHLLDSRVSVAVFA